jgi:hypothetical protein
MQRLLHFSLLSATLRGLTSDNSGADLSQDGILARETVTGYPSGFRAQ